MSRTASPGPVFHAVANDSENAPFNTQHTDKISAYYSLVFPKFTYYLQTLSVTIGRRCIPASTASTSDQAQVDVDLGPLKSVSRLHARIDYEEEEERFVLVVLGRNGAWVDGAWSGKGSKVPLGERSQIQIASRTFLFMLPPPPAPEDSPSPSSRASSRRARSPSVDITGMDVTPPSSIPSISPPPPANSPPLPRKPAPHELPLPGKGKGNTGNKKRKADKPPQVKPAEPEPPKPRPKPEEMPPKPPFTYAQLCYRAIKDMDGRGTLQEIVHWMMRNYTWYDLNQGTGWEKSVRHNLSSNRAFRKVERQAGDRGKGYYWTIEPSYEAMFEEQEARAAKLAAEGHLGLGKTKGKGKAPSSAAPQSQVKPEPMTLALPSAHQPTPFVQSQLLSSVPPPIFPSAFPIPLSRLPQSTPSTQASASPAPAHAIPVTTPSVRQPTSTPVTTSTATLMTVSAPAPIPAPIVTPIPAAPKPVLPSFKPPPPVLPAALTKPAPIPTPVPAPAPTLAPAPSSLTATVPTSTSPLPVVVPIVVGPAPAAALANAQPSTNPLLPETPIVLHENTLYLSPPVFGHLSADEIKTLQAQGVQAALSALQTHIVRYLRDKKRAEKGGKKRKKEKREKDRAAPAAPVLAAAPQHSAPMLEEPGSPILIVDDDEDEAPAPKRRKLDIGPGVLAASA